MSKAFTRESDADQDDDDGAPLTPLVTPDGKNYITRAGYERLRAELFALIDEERPKIVEIVHWAASNGDRSENGDYLYGTKRLEIAEVVDPSLHHGGDQVFFGATVVVADRAGVETTVTIMGVDEAESAQGQISWVSPMARALLKARLGDVIRLMVPGGVQELEVVAVDYPAPAAGPDAAQA
jgi:transcription elongation factor GreB